MELDPNPNQEDLFSKAIKDLEFGDISPINLSPERWSRNSEKFKLDKTVEQIAPIHLWETFDDVRLDSSRFFELLKSIQDEPSLLAVFADYQVRIANTIEYPVLTEKKIHVVGGDILPPTLGTKDVLVILNYIEKLEDSQKHLKMAQEAQYILFGIHLQKQSYILSNVRIGDLLLPGTGHTFISTTSKHPRSVTRTFSNGKELKIIYIPYAQYIDEENLIDIAAIFENSEESPYPPLPEVNNRDLHMSIVDCKTTPKDELIEAIQTYIWMNCREMQIIRNFREWVLEQPASNEQSKIANALTGILRRYRKVTLLNISDPLNELNFMSDKPHPLRKLQGEQVCFTDRPDSIKPDKIEPKTERVLYEEIDQLLNEYT